MTDAIRESLDRFERSAETWARHMTEAHGPGPGSETCASPKAMCLARQLTWESAAIDLAYALRKQDRLANEATPPADFGEQVISSGRLPKDLAEAIERTRTT